MNTNDQSKPKSEHTAMTVTVQAKDKSKGMTLEELTTFTDYVTHQIKIGLLPHDTIIKTRTGMKHNLLAIQAIPKSEDRGFMHTM